MRAMARLPESPNTMKNTEFDSSPNIRIGLLPRRSDREPRIGVKMNCAREYVAITTPTQKSREPLSTIPSADARSWTKYVRNGMTRVRPSMSTKTTRNRIPIGERSSLSMYPGDAAGTGI